MTFNTLNLFDLPNGRSIGTHLLPAKSYINLTRISADGKSALVSYSLDSVDHYLLLKLSNQGIQPVGELPKPGDAKCYDFAISQDGTELYSYAFWTRKGRGGTNFMLRWKVN